MIERQIPAMHSSCWLRFASETLIKTVLAWMSTLTTARTLTCMALEHCCPSPPIHLIGQNDLIGTTDSLCGRDGGAIAGAADITV